MELNNTNIPIVIPVKNKENIIESALYRVLIPERDYDLVICFNEMFKVIPSQNIYVNVKKLKNKFSLSFNIFKFVGVSKAFTTLGKNNDIEIKNKKKSFAIGNPFEKIIERIIFKVMYGPLIK